MSLELDPIYEEALLAPAWGPGMQELQVLAGPVGAAVDFVSSAGMAKKRELKAWKDGECVILEDAYEHRVLWPNAPDGTLRPGMPPNSIFCNSKEQREAKRGVSDDK